jgi:hypothetical protein
VREIGRLPEGTETRENVNGVEALSHSDAGGNDEGTGWGRRDDPSSTRRRPSPTRLGFNFYLERFNDPARGRKTFSQIITKQQKIT